MDHFLGDAKKSRLAVRSHDRAPRRRSLDTREERAPQGDVGDAMYFLLEGVVELRSGQLELSRLEPGGSSD